MYLKIVRRRVWILAYLLRGQCIVLSAAERISIAVYHDEL